jgi:DNA-binding NtrC family response regulator
MARILISEADRDVRRLLTVLVQRLGHEAVVGDQGVDVPPRVDLLLVDPSDDAAVARARAARTAQPDIPVICMGQISHDARFLLDGPFEYLPKPFAFEQLARALSR